MKLLPEIVLPILIFLAGFTWGQLIEKRIIYKEQIPQIVNDSFEVGYVAALVCRDQLNSEQCYEILEKTR